MEFQADQKAAPALRSILFDDQQEQFSVLRAVTASHGFSDQEMATAVETAAIAGIDDESGEAIYYMPAFKRQDLSLNLGKLLIADGKLATDGTAAFLVSRIESLDRSNPALASVLRRCVVGWSKKAVARLFLSDISRDRSSMAAVLRVMADRKRLVDEVPDAVTALRTGTPYSQGLAECILGDVPGQMSNYRTRKAGVAGGAAGMFADDQTAARGA